MRKLLLWTGAIILAALLYNLDAITGQWKFDRMCKAEGGPHFLAAVEKDVGWEVAGHDSYDYQWPFEFDHVAFVRYQDKQGNRSDVRTDGYIGPGQRKYIFSAVDKSRPIRYSFSYKNARLPDDDRFSRTQYQVVEVVSGKLVASHTAFGYQWTRPEQVILSAPTGVGCWNLQSDTAKFFHGLYEAGAINDSHLSGYAQPANVDGSIGVRNPVVRA